MNCDAWQGWKPLFRGSFFFPQIFFFREFRCILAGQRSSRRGALALSFSFYELADHNLYPITFFLFGLFFFSLAKLAFALFFLFS